MPKYWGRFPEVGQKQKTEREKKKKKKEERLNDGDNNGQATHGTRKPPGPKDWTMVVTMAKVRMAHASHLGQKEENILVGVQAIKLLCIFLLNIVNVYNLE